LVVGLIVGAASISETASCGRLATTLLTLPIILAIISHDVVIAVALFLSGKFGVGNHHPDLLPEKFNPPARNGFSTRLRLPERANFL